MTEDERPKFFNTTVLIDPVHYFSCAECNKLQSRERRPGERLSFCAECSRILCQECFKKHPHPLIEISPEDLTTRLTEAYKNYMPHLFPENLQFKP